MHQFELCYGFGWCSLSLWSRKQKRLMALIRSREGAHLIGGAAHLALGWISRASPLVMCIVQYTSQIPSVFQGAK